MSFLHRKHDSMWKAVSLNISLNRSIFSTYDLATDTV